MWEKISVWQYQQIYNVLNSKDKNDTDLDINVRLVAIVILGLGVLLSKKRNQDSSNHS